MNPRTIASALCLLLLPALACDDGGPLDDPALDAAELSPWEADKLREADARVLLDYAAQLGFHRVEGLSFAFPVDGMAFAEFEDEAHTPAYLSFDLDDEGDTRVTTLVMPEPLPRVYGIVDGEVVAVAGETGAATELGAEQAEADNQCHSWGSCNCGMFALAAGACLVHGYDTPAYYDCIRAICS